MWSSVAVAHLLQGCLIDKFGPALARACVCVCVFLCRLMFGRNGHFSEGEHGAGYHNYIHSPATLLGTPIQLLGNTNS